MTTNHRPRIGLTLPKDPPTPYNRYVEAIEAAGGEAVLISPETDLRVLDELDGLVLAGGRDVHPRYYGQRIKRDVPEPVDVDGARDALELAVIPKALERDLPVLGICRGIQVLNVALGGTLLQDLSLAGIDLPAHQQRKREPEPPEWQPVHTVSIEPESRLAGLLGTEEVKVNSFHHQATAEPAPSLRVVARSADGVIEGLEDPTRRFVVGVQWHPERMFGRHAEQRALFTALIEAAREQHGRRSVGRTDAGGVGGGPGAR